MSACLAVLVIRLTSESDFYLRATRQNSYRLFSLVSSKKAGSVRDYNEGLIINMAENSQVQQLPLPRQDGYLLHFLKELPAWVILGMFTAGFLIVWQFSHDDFIPRIIDGLVGALLLSLQRPKAAIVPPATNINADSVDSVNLQNKEKE